MRTAIGIYLLLHGFCHFVGFVVPWKSVNMKDEPYVTTLIAGALNVGGVGIRIVGLLWLITGLAFMASGTGIFVAWSSWRPLAFGLAIFSVVLCILGLPGAKIGILANALVLLYMLGVKIGWVS